jgi:ADP-heptose:LPS heptosyltransferase
LTGQCSLYDLIAFINRSDALVAASTGVLHIASALGKRTVGIYAPMRPIDPGRWGPIGPNATHLVIDKKCNRCRGTYDCECIRSIRPEMVKQALEDGCANRT